MESKGVTMTTLTPAYGRDYTSKKAAIKDFREGKDFILNDIMSRWDGKPCSIRDLKKGDSVKIRYGKLRKVMVVTV